MTTLVICEKANQARDIKAALGESFGLIIPCEGHILRLAEPHEVVPEWKAWGFVSLKPPAHIGGGFYPHVPDGSTPGKSRALARIRDALRSASRVISATDCDREGQAIGDEVLIHLGYRGPVERAIFTAQDPKTLREAFARLKDNKTFKRRYDAAWARQQADQIYNLMLTRALSLLFDRRGQTRVVGAGRVKTPTLAIAARREIEIRTFKPIDYFTVAATATAAGSPPFVLKHVPEQRILDRRVAEAIRSAADGHSGALAVKTEARKTPPPRLFDLPSLQKACARWGWTAAKTLEVGQALYDEHKLITYIRAEAKHLAENQIANVAELVRGLGRISGFAGLVPKDPVIRRGKGGAFSDAALANVSHHAVIPNVRVMDEAAKRYRRLGSDERRLFDLIAKRYLANLSPDYEFDLTTVEMTLVAAGDGRLFRANASVPRIAGWKPVVGIDVDDEEENGPSLPRLKDGTVARLGPVALEACKTEAPSRYNEGTLIEAMQQAHKFLDESALADRLARSDDPLTRLLAKAGQAIDKTKLQDRLREAKGIGTPATRDTVIEGLKAQQQLQPKGKQLVPTDRGLEIYRLCSEIAPVVVDPGTTALWELLFDLIEEGRIEAKTVVEAVTAEAGRVVAAVEAHCAKVGPRPPSEAMAKAAKARARDLRIALPAAALTDGAACKAFLDGHPRPAGAAGFSPPTGNQLAFARKIASERRIELPDGLGTQALSDWIDRHKDGGRLTARPHRTARQPRRAQR